MTRQAVSILVLVLVVLVAFWGMRAGWRARTRRSSALVTSLPAAPDVFVPTGALRGAATAPGMAGKFVGGDGLVVLTWQADPDDPRGLDTGLRPRHAADRPLLVGAVTALIDATSGTKEQS